MLAATLAVTLAMAGDIGQRHFPVCGAGRRVTCVVDGDTFWLDRLKYRVANIDAPEATNPRCNAEARLAEASTRRLAQFLNEGPFQLKTRGKDRYGRTLAIVSRSGYSFGTRLVNEGLARLWGDRRGWC
jgi:micrococcal nuclease